MTRLNDSDFSHLVRVAPLISIDIILRDSQSCVFVGQRTNEPAKNLYFVPGGVIRKNERIASAFARILTAETGLDLPFSHARLLGAYEHFYETNRYDDRSFGTHYVVLGYEYQFQARPTITLDDQHCGLRWMSVAELMTASDVHDNTKAYFEGRPA